MIVQKDRQPKEALRVKAEELLKKTPAELKEVNPNQIKNLLQELEIHRVELELQNEELRRAQLDLQTSHDRFSALFNNAPVGYIVLDSTGIIRQANTTWTRMINRVEDDLHGIPFADLLIKEDAKIFLSRFRSFFKHPNEKSIEVRVKRTSSEDYFFAHIEAQLYFDNSSEEDAHAQDVLLVNITDITTQKQAEQKLTHLNQVLSAIRNVNQLIVREKDPQKLIEFTCKNLYLKMGYHNAWIALLDETNMEIKATASSNLSDNFDSLKSLFDRKKQVNCMNRIFNGDNFIVVVNPISECPGCPMTEHYADRAGLIRRLEFDNKIYGIISVSVPANYAYEREEQDLFNELADDLSFALHKIEADEELQRLKHIVTTIPQTLSFISRDYRYLAVNDAYSEFYNVSRDQIIGKKLTFFLGQQLFEKRIKLYLDRCFSGEIVRYEIQVDFPIKGSRWMEMEYFPYRNEKGEITSVVSHGLDITDRKRAEDALKESEKRFRQIYENMSVGIARVSLYFQIESANEAYCNMLGYTEKELIGKHIKDITLLETNDENKRKQEMLASGSIDHYRMEKQFIHKDGHIMHGIYDANLIRNADGKPIYFLKSIIDITDRKIAENNLFESERKYRELFENSRDGFVVINNKGKFIDANHAFCQMLGYQLKELKNKADFYEITHPRWHNWEKEEIWKKRLMRKGYSGIYEKEYIKKDGSIFKAEIQSYTVFDEKSKPRYIWRIVRDITDRMKAEEATRESEEKYRLLAETTRDIIVLHDMEGRIVYFNQAGLDLSGYEGKEILGNSVAKLISPEHLNDLVARRKKRISGDEQAYRYETDFLNKAGAKIPIEVNSTPILRKGKVREILLVARDITERKLVEKEREKYQHQLEKQVEARTAQLRAANNELEAFAYSVSHDLRAPLRAINGFTRILMEKYVENLDEEGQRLGTIIQQNTQKMGQLIDDLLSFSRLGRTAMHFLFFDMNEMVDIIYKDATTIQERKRISFTCDNLPKVKADPNMIRQVWMNLISNAIKFSSKRKHPVISITFEENEENYTFCIKDNGAGFDMKYKDKLFSVFQRLHNENEFEGTGVGLALVQRIIFRLGGNIWAQSTINKGASFYFSLPKIQN